MPRREAALPGVTKLPDGRFRVLVNLGTDATGKRRQTRRTFASLREANAFRVDTLRARDAGTRPDDGGATVRAHCERWLSLPTERRGGATRANYRSALANNVYPGLGTVRLDRLTPLVLQKHFDALLALGRPLPSVLAAYKALRGAMRQAVAWGMVGRNPCDGVVLPSARPAPAAALSLPEARALLEVASGDRVFGPLVAVLLHTGLRVGEACALAWADVDLDRGLLRVRRRVTRDEAGRWVVAEGAKSRRGVRTVALGAEAVAWFRRQRAAQNGWRLAMGDAWPETDLVFTRPPGTGVRLDAAAKALRLLCEAAGLPRLTPHDLRHTHSTLVAEVAGNADLLVLQERLGHGTLEMTRRYVHPTTDAQARLAEGLDERLRGEG